jgi:alpha-methylacyl-CoA racemase
MTDGSALLSAMTWSQLNAGLWKDERGVNWLDTGAHFYDTYECADGECISIGSIEPQFYALLREKAGLSDAEFDAQMDAAKWPELKSKLADVFATKTRAEWCEIMEGTDVCFAPVLGLNEALEHPHNAARGTFIEVDGHPMPAPAPRYSGTKNSAPRPAPEAGADSEAVLAELGYTAAEIDDMRRAGALG